MKRVWASAGEAGSGLVYLADERRRHMPSFLHALLHALGGRVVHVVYGMGPRALRGGVLRVLAEVVGPARLVRVLVEHVVGIEARYLDQERYMRSED